ncbi:DUF1146 family protein [Companilactobacillus mishanensis]|uniref:DUF1146 domain-containing protein n=1 Tax=Companilactobacillus mishanensis TaxID=2486008 RepID=A0A5P0ZGP7_9LACO|nr:DUF1146 family protein [Companilactobacillus mishanensis]MQS44018.1 DUF1146 domain-containing protein [Companilactobacillus mishanensis]MQS52227.1 DUF1146 domain-containing protein [Companilactobacillus mishanensis]MQS88317.1 DUF1146 domain-containing protein [Companilactobacillus mishanensis]
MRSLGLTAIITIISHLLFIWLSYNALQAIDWRKIYNKSNPKMLQLLVALVSIALGYTVSSFVLSLISVSQNLTLLF